MLEDRNYQLKLSSSCFSLVVSHVERFKMSGRGKGSKNKKGGGGKVGGGPSSSQPVISTSKSKSIQKPSSSQSSIRKPLESIDVNSNFQHVENRNVEDFLEFEEEDGDEILNETIQAQEQENHPPAPENHPPAPENHHPDPGPGPEDEDDSISWVPARKGGKNRTEGKLLLHRNFLYRVKKTVNEKQYLYCREKWKQQCPVTACLSNGQITLKHDHSHDSDLMAKTVSDIVGNKIKEVNSNTELPRTVWQKVTNEVLRQVGDEGLDYLPKYETFGKRVWVKCSSMIPKLPKSYQELLVFPEQFSRTSDDQPFMVLSSGFETEDKSIPKILGFCSPSGIETLRSSGTWYADGTFFICSRIPLFTQLYVILGTTSTGVGVPCAYYLTSDKTQATYEKIFSNLRELGLEGPERLMTDFEKAVLNAQRAIFPTTISVCCDVHWKRALRTNITEKGLLSFYNSSMDFQQFVKLVWILSLVALEDIEWFWTNFVMPRIPYEKIDDGDSREDVTKKEAVNAKLNQFKTYLEDTYIGGLSPSGRRRNPRFSHRTYNKHEDIILMDTMTTNMAESFNKHIVMTLRSYPNIWVLVQGLIKEEGISRQKIASSNLGQKPTYQSDERHAKMVRKKKFLREIVQTYSRQNVMTFARKAVRFYGDFLFE